MLQDLHLPLCYRIYIDHYATRFTFAFMLHDLHLPLFYKIYICLYATSFIFTFMLQVLYLPLCYKFYPLTVILDAGSKLLELFVSFHFTISSVSFYIFHFLFRLYYGLLDFTLPQWWKWDPSSTLFHPYLFTNHSTIQRKNYKFQRIKFCSSFVFKYCIP